MDNKKKSNKYVFLVFFSGPDHPEHSCYSPDDSTLQLLNSPHQLLNSQDAGGDGGFCGGDKTEDIAPSM